jgi:predicted DNA-binding transcriptional regulator YafY
VGVTPELARWVFRWGTGCEVLEPVELRTMVAEMARKVAEVHTDNSTDMPTGGTEG